MNYAFSLFFIVPKEEEIAIGSKLDALSAEMIVESLVQRGMILENAGKLMMSAISERSYTDIPVNLRCLLRASILKNMLLTQI